MKLSDRPANLSLSLSSLTTTLMAVQINSGRLLTQRVRVSTKAATRTIHTVPKRQDAVATEGISHQPAGKFAPLTTAELGLTLNNAVEIGEEIISTYFPTTPRSTSSPPAFSYAQYFSNQIQQKKDDKVKPFQVLPS